MSNCNESPAFATPDLKIGVLSQRRAGDQMEADNDGFCAAELCRRVAPLSVISTTKVEPRPGPSLNAETVPPCSSTRCLVIDSPMPRPDVSRVDEESSCRKRSNTCGRNAREMP